MRRSTAAALLALGVAGAACTSVPVSTLWKFARFDRAALLAVDPAQLRAAALVDQRATMKNVTMKVTLTPKDSKESVYVVMLAAPVSRDARLPGAPAGRHWEIFALTAEGQRDFLRMREAGVSLPPGSSLALTLSAREGTVPPDLVRRFPLRLDLMLDTREGWFTVLKDAEVDLTPMIGKG